MNNNIYLCIYKYIYKIIFIKYNKYFKNIIISIYIYIYII